MGSHVLFRVVLFSDALCRVLQEYTRLVLYYYSTDLFAPPRLSADGSTFSGLTSTVPGSLVYSATSVSPALRLLATVLRQVKTKIGEKAKAKAHAQARARVLKQATTATATAATATAAATADAVEMETGDGVPLPQWHATLWSTDPSLHPVPSQYYSNTNNNITYTSASTRNTSSDASDANASTYEVSASGSSASNVSVSDVSASHVSADVRWAEGVLRRGRAVRNRRSKLWAAEAARLSTAGNVSRADSRAASATDDTDVNCNSDSAMMRNNVANSVPVIAAHSAAAAAAAWSALASRHSREHINLNLLTIPRSNNVSNSSNSISCSSVNNASASANGNVSHNTWLPDPEPQLAARHPSSLGHWALPESALRLWAQALGPAADDVLSLGASSLYADPYYDDVVAGSIQAVLAQTRASLNISNHTTLHNSSDFSARSSNGTSTT